MKLIFNEGLTSKFRSFKKRLLINLTWFIVLILAISIYLFIRDGITSLILTGPFLFFFVLYLVYYTYKNDYKILLYLELNSDKSKATIKINKMDAEYIDEEFQIEYLKFKVKKVFSGIGGNPKYSLAIYFKNDCLIKQRGNLVWSNQKLKEIGDKITVFIGEEINHN